LTTEKSLFHTLLSSAPVVMNFSVSKCTRRILQQSLRLDIWKTPMRVKKVFKMLGSW
jgi:hypothetical protein